MRAKALIHTRYMCASCTMYVLCRAFSSRMSDQEKLTMASMRDEIDTSTYHLPYTQEIKNTDQANKHSSTSNNNNNRQQSLADDRGPSAISSFSSSSSSSSSSSARPSDRKREREDIKLTLEELMPKETGREARLEKKRQKGSYAHRPDARGELDEVDDATLMGSSSSSSADNDLARLKLQAARRDAAREAELREKRLTYADKEKERMKKMLSDIGQADKYPMG